MIRLTLAALALATLAAPALAIDFEETERGQIEFTMPSGNIGCVYTPEGGTDVYEPVDGGPELLCDRVAPSYVRVILGPAGKAKRHTDVGDASCCGSDNVFGYGDVWKMGGFRCASSSSGVRCTRGSHGFTMSRNAVKAW